MHRSPALAVLRVVASCVVAGAPLSAQLPAAAPPALARQAAGVMRADVALAYRSLDLATSGRTLSSDSLAELNRRVDAATLAVRAGRTADAVRGLREATVDFGGGTGTRVVTRQLAALRVSLVPRVLIRGRADVDPHVVIAPLYPLSVPSGVAPGDSVRGVVRFTRGDQLVTEVPFAIAATAGPDEPRSIPVNGDLLRRVDAGRIALAAPGAPRASARPDDGRWFVAARSPDDVRVDLLRQAEVFDTLLPPELLTAGATFRARARSLVAEPVPSGHTPFYDNPVTLARDLKQEYDRLVIGGNPYADRYGDLWRLIRARGKVIPLRLYVPLVVARGRQQAPLVIVLHDDGGDENTFPDAFSGIVGLADSNRFILASVNADTFAATGDEFDALVGSIAADVHVDGARIFVIGHGRGAEQVITLAAARTARIAGVACLAGLGRVPPGAMTTPTLVIVGAIDPISGADQVKPFADAAIAAGAPFDIHVIPNQGHTLIVRAMLPTAIEWLFKHARTVRAR